MKWEISPELRELVERAELAHQRFYVGELKNRLEQTAWGKYVAIHIDTGEYLVADSQDEALAEFHARFPATLAYTVRIGVPRLVA